MAAMSGESSSLAIVRLDHDKRVVQKSDLNSNFWERLPECLEEEILAKVPLSSLATSRSVCKAWRDLIHSSSVVLWFNSGHARLVYFSRGHLFVLNKGTWETFSLQFVPCGLKSMAMSTSGLVCLRTSEDWEFIVCNPLNKCYKRLQVPCSKVSTVTGQPCMPTPEPGSSTHFPLRATLFAGMVVNCDTGHFKLIVGGFFPGSQGTTLVYDSHVDSWKKAANMPSYVLEVGRVHFRDHHPVIEKLSCGGNLYFHFKDRHREERLLEYNVGKQVWCWIDVPFCESCNFMQHNGKLLAVFRVEHVREYMVYELQDAGSSRKSYNWRKNWLPKQGDSMGNTSWPFSRVERAVPCNTRIEFWAEGDAMYSIRRSAGLSLVPQRTSVRGRFHEVATNSFVMTDWEGYILDDHEGFQTFTPCSILLN